MSLTATLWSQLQAALLLLLPFCLLPQGLRDKPILRSAAALLALGLAFLPLGSPQPSAWLYAYSGALSLPTLALLANLVSRRLWSREILPQPDRRLLLIGAAVAGLLLYPMALGLGPFDPYALGQTGPVLPLLAAAAAGLAWWRGRRGAALVLLAALWCWLPTLGESANLWDYLLDGWLWLYALTWVSFRLVTRA